MWQGWRPASPRDGYAEHSDGETLGGDIPFGDNCRFEVTKCTLNRHAVLLWLGMFLMVHMRTWKFNATHGAIC